MLRDTGGLMGGHTRGCGNPSSTVVATVSASDSSSPMEESTVDAVSGIDTSSTCFFFRLL